MSLVIRHARLVLPTAVEEGDCWVEGPRIAAVGEFPPPSHAGVLDAHGLFLAPGFMDLHVHGGGGGDFALGDPASARKAVEFHTQFGTTGLLAALPPAPWEKLARACQALMGIPGVLGVYLEGPFLSPAKAGALPADRVLTPTPEALAGFRRFLSRWRNFVRVVVLAPEVDPDGVMLAEVVASGAVAALGHSDASYEQAMEAVRKGAQLFTHLGNAMRGLHHREPGLVGAALDCPAYVELICDGVHVHPAFVGLVARVKGLDRICLVTDAMPAVGLGDGLHPWEERAVVVRSGVARLPDGPLAGSTLTMNRAVRNFQSFAGCSLSEAVRCATLNPAQLLGLAHQWGSLEVGKQADLALWDETLEVQLVLRAGKVVYARRGWA